MIDRIKDKLKSIHQKNGYLFDVTDIAEDTDASELRPRGISLCRENGSVEISINAKSKTLDEMKQYIHELLDAEFTITEAGESLLVANPKNTGLDDDAAT